ncbi:MAG: hypothetical protein R2788_19680 [Saprospiraceae bacterium]
MLPAGFEADNNGQSFSPLFDHETVMTLGDIAVDWGQQHHLGERRRQVNSVGRAIRESACSRVWMVEKHGSTRAYQRAITLAGNTTRTIPIRYG